MSRYASTLDRRWRSPLNNRSALLPTSEDPFLNSSLLRGLSVAACALALSACNKPTTPPAAVTPAPASGVSDDQKTLYTMGFIAGQQFAQFKLTPEEFTSVQKGMEAASQGKKAEHDVTTYQPRIEPFLQAKVAQARVANVGVAQTRKTADAMFVTKAAAEPGAVKLESGAVVVTLTPGKGDSPKPTSTVKVHYEGKLTDGTVFDSSIQRGQPVEFPLNGVIPCWTQGVAKMKVGEKARLTCPSDTAYGDQGQGPIPPGATLIFEVELLSIK